MKYKKQVRKTKKIAFLRGIVIVEVALAANWDALAAFEVSRMEAGQPAKGYQNCFLMQGHPPNVTKENITPKSKRLVFSLHQSKTSSA